MMDKLMNNKPKLIISFSGCSKKDNAKDADRKPNTLQTSIKLTSIKQATSLPVYKFS